MSEHNSVSGGTVMKTNNLTCLNCRVTFYDAQIQREHYKSDWHRYNLKRKVADLPPVTHEEFQRRLLVIQQENEVSSSGRNYTYCSVCKKSFASEHSFSNHLQSKKHLDLSKNVEDVTDIVQPSVKNMKSKNQTMKHLGEPASDDEDSDVDTASSGTEEVDSDGWEGLISEDNPILRNDCLFCPKHSASLSKNVKHMSIDHSFFIPHIEYLIDLEGLLLYLGEKICQGYMCLWCNERKSSFNSVEAVRSHMIDKGHVKIPTDTENSLDYLPFYNFNLEIDGVDEDGEDKGENERSPEAEPMKKLSNADNSEAVTMVLPSGDLICHRSLLRYFKQNPVVTQKKLVPHVKESKVQKLIKLYRDLGWNPKQKEILKKKLKDIKYINFIQSKYETKLRVKTNKLHKRIRPQVDF